MGVYVDRITGYRMDVTKEFDENDEERLWDKYIDENFLMKNSNKKLSEAGFIPYHNTPRPGKDNITLVYDGMCGDYVWLVYIQDVDYYSDDQSDENKLVNDALKMVPVPDDVKKRMRECYKEIFKNECAKDIFMQEMCHWH